MSAVVNMAGKVFGRLTVRRRDGSSKRGLATWLCLCECGSSAIVTGADLRTGHTTSCGCFGAEVRRTSNVTHGFSRNGHQRAGYWQWAAMIKRCKLDGHPLYGGRGIRVCERWRRFENFLADMGPRPSPTHSIDRIDPNGHYEPGNCRWATSWEQAANTRRNVFVEKDGIRLHVREWSRRTGIPEATIARRLRRGLSAPEVLSPVRRKNQFVAGDLIQYLPPDQQQDVSDAYGRRYKQLKRED